MRFLPLVLLGFLALPGAAVAEAPALPTGIVGVVPVDGSSATALATQAEAPAKPAIVIPSQIDVPLSGRLLSGVGLIVLMALAWLLSSNRRKVPWRLMAWGVGLQLVFALILLRSGKAQATLQNRGEPRKVAAAAPAGTPSSSPSPASQGY